MRRAVFRAACLQPVRSCADTCSTSWRCFTSDSTSYVTQLHSRTAVLVEGQDAAAFLQGLVTNDMRPLETPGAGPVYASLLTPKGKFLHDLFAHSLPGAPGRLLLEVDASGKDHLLQWLTRYKLRRPLTLHDASSDYTVWAAWGPAAAAAAAVASPEAGSGVAAAPGGGTGWCPDPRLPQLGLRAVLPTPTSSSSSSSGSTSSSASASAYGQQVPEQHHQQLRYQLGVPEGDAEMPTEKVNPLEFNLDVLNGVSYTKGCYIGQERNSFTHFRGVIRRRLMPVVLTAQDPEQLTAAQPGCEVLHNGRSIGKLMATAGPYGLAHLLLQPALATAAAAAAGVDAGGSSSSSPVGLQLGAGTGSSSSSSIGVMPVRPAWWPAEWGYEEQAAAAG